LEYRFTHLSGTLQGHIDTLETAPILMGRDEACQVKLDKHKDTVVSSQHAQIDEVSEGTFQLANLSRNGTWVNGVLVESSAKLPNHSVIQLGRNGPRIRFDVDESMGGISFAQVKQKSAKLNRGEPTPAPETEERPIFKVSSEEKTASKVDARDLGMLPLIAVIVAGVLVLGGVLFVILKH
jgi:pSer/pThr/pTyr-binding forkhead associated (FHA) protein